MKAQLSTLKPDFAARWNRWYPNAPPVGFLLRDSYPDRWVRVHTMTGSKRSPNSGWDYAELSRRYNALAGYVLGDQASCALIIVHECGSPLSRQLAEAGIDASRLSDLGQLPSELWDEDEGVFAAPMCIRGAATSWQHGAFDAYFAAVAQDYIKGLLVEEQRGQVVAPYDGGADLFLATSWDVEQAKREFAAWLSLRPDSL